MGWNGYGMGWWTWPLMLAVVVGLWALIFIVLRTVTRNDGRAVESPLQLLDRRLAKGEIDLEEYERRRRAITTGH